MSKHGGASLTCPKCRRREHVLCLAGGITSTYAWRTPFYCTSCKLSFEAKEKKEIKNWSKFLSFEVLASDPKP